MVQHGLGARLHGSMGTQCGPRGLQHRVYSSFTGWRKNYSGPIRSLQTVYLGGRPTASSSEESSSSYNRFRVPLPVVLTPKEILFLAIHSKLTASECNLRSSPEVSNEDSLSRHSFLTERNVGSILRPFGCVSPHLDLFQESEIYRFQLQGRGLPFELSTSLGVFTGVMRVVAGIRKRGILLFSYLNDWLILEATQRSVNVCDKRNGQSSKFFRMADKSEVASHSDDVTFLPGGKDRLRSWQGVSFREQNRFHSGSYSSFRRKCLQPSLNLVKSVGSDGQPSRCFSPLSPAHATNSIPSSDLLQIGVARSSDLAPAISFNPLSPPMVVREVEPVGEKPIWRGASTFGGHNRRFTVRLGSLLRSKDVSRRLVRRGIETSQSWNWKQW